MGRLQSLAAAVVVAVPSVVSAQRFADVTIQAND
jgi:hypothetical protein